MGVSATGEIDAWLRAGGSVTAASDRAARALAADYHRTRRAEGLRAWPAPNILDWKSFVRAAWEQRTADGRLLLNPVQEQALWTEIAAAKFSVATLLDGPRHRLAALALDAHALLCSYAPKFLQSTTRSAWQQDAAVFSRWLAAFDDRCRAGNLLSPSRLPLELTALLAQETAPRPPLLLAGFDRIPPAQRELLRAWGTWQEVPPGEPATEVRFHAAIDPQAELQACALWCGHRLALAPQERILVVAQNPAARRGEIERAFLAPTGLAPTGPAAQFEFSLGVPLAQVTPARAAHLLLHWLEGALPEQELDWLFSTGLAAASAAESAALPAYLRALRERGLERPQWALQDFIRPHSSTGILPASWIERILAVQRRLGDAARRAQSPLAWAELAPRLLEQLGFAHSRTLESAEFQALSRWRQAVESCGSLGFDGRVIGWKDFLVQLDRALKETLFAPESREAPIQIAGPAESAGLAADAIWFLGADEDAWPAGGSAHPLLPLQVQREAGMPHATAQLDWELAHSITQRLLISAPTVHFSFARQPTSAEARPSRLIAKFAGQPQPLPLQRIAAVAQAPATVLCEDFSRIPFLAGVVAGGSSVLTAQSQCPFKAFATTRLNAKKWDLAATGLTPAQRGSLLHAVLHAVWSGPPSGLRSHSDLLALPDRTAFVAAHAHRALSENLRADLRERMPRRYLELEEQRLTRLVTQWLDYEAARIPFDVVETEAERTVPLAGLTFRLRLDRLDRLSDRSQLIIDYKSGEVSPSAWNTPRPSDVQLPLYAGFALDPGEELGGLVFAEVRPAKMEFSGRVGDATATLFASLKGTSALVKNPFTAEQLLDWRDCIQQLAKDFIDGRAEVDPRDSVQTCVNCGLQTLCRIQEQSDDLAVENSADEEADDE